MKMKTLHSLTLVLLVLLVRLPAKAALVQATDPRFGPNSLILDTSTQLAWLNLTKSADLSYNQVLADTAPGGIFSGYRYATDDEILGLIASAGIPGPGFYPLTNGPVQSLISLVGPLGTTYGLPAVTGITGSNVPGYAEQDSADMYALGISGTIEYEVTVGGNPGISASYGRNTSYPTLGSWLVMEVPEPSACFMTIGALIGFAFAKRCKKW